MLGILSEFSRSQALADVDDHTMDFGVGIDCPQSLVDSFGANSLLGTISESHGEVVCWVHVGYSTAFPKKSRLSSPVS